MGLKEKMLKSMKEGLDVDILKVTLSDMAENPDGSLTFSGKITVKMPSNGD